MKCEEVIENLSLFFDQELDSGTGDLITKHLEKCLPCRILWNTFTKSIELFRSYMNNTKLEVSLDLHNRMFANLKNRLSDQ